MNDVTPANAGVPPVSSALAAAVYVRVSTGNQADQDRYGLEAQENACRAYAATHNLRVTGVYTDVISGTKESRSGLEQLLREAPRYRAVIVYAIDRIARNVPLAYKLLDEFQQAGLDVHSSSEGVQSLADDASALRFGIYAVFADHERRRITKRMYAGKLEKARQGIPVIRIQAFGYKNSEIYEPEAKWVRFIYDNARHHGARWIANRLNELGVTTRSGAKWGKNHVRDIVTKPLYRGAWEYGPPESRIQVPCPSIVSPEEWTAAQVAVGGRLSFHGRPGSRDHIFELQGHIQCTHCGYAMSGWMKSRLSVGRTYPYYKCQHSPAVCIHNKYHQHGAVHLAVRQALLHLLEDDATLAAALQITPVTPLNTKPDIDRLSSQLKRAKDGYLNDVFTLEEFQEVKLSISRRIAALEKEARELPTKANDINAARDRLTVALRHGSLRDIARAANLRVFLSLAGEIKLELNP